MPIKMSKGGVTPPPSNLGTTDTGVPAQTAQANAGKAAVIPFTSASIMSSMIASGLSATAGEAITPNPFGLPTRGFLRGVWVAVTISSTGNSATVANPTGLSNFPFNYLSNLSFMTPAGKNLLPPNFNGWLSYLDNKYLGRGLRPFDPKCDPQYTAPSTGAGATAGSGKFILYLPVELDSVDAFAALANADGAAEYPLNIVTSTAANAYSQAGGNETAGTAPNGTVTLSFELMLDYWPVPAKQGAAIAPASLGARSFLDLATPPVNSGSSSVKVTTVGSNIRAMIFSVYTSAGYRTDNDFPNLTKMSLEGVEFFARYKDIWQREMAQLYNYKESADSAGGIDNGVYVYCWPIARQGFVSADSPRSQWLRTAPGSDLQFIPSSFGSGASTLQIVASRVTMPNAQPVGDN